MSWPRINEGQALQLSTGRRGEQEILDVPQDLNGKARREDPVMKTAKYAARNAQIVVSDPDSEIEVPRWTKNVTVRLISTDTCILVGCLIGADGETEFTLGKMHQVDPGHVPAFEGTLKTPNHKISLESVDGHTVLEAPVLQRETKFESGRITKASQTK